MEAEVNPETIDKIKESLEPLASKLGQGAEFAYEVVYRQVLAEAAVGLALFALVGVALSIGVPKLVKFGLRKYQEDRSSEWDFVVYLAAVPVIVYLMLLVGLGVRYVLTLLNPHYYAIERILDIVKGGQL